MDDNIPNIFMSAKLQNAWNNFIEKMKIFDDKEVISTSFTINMDDNTTIEVMEFEFL